jgi:hypothetical protein
MAAVMETRLLQAQSENMAPIDLVSTLVSDELVCRSNRLLERRHKQAQFRDADKRLDNFDFQFNPKMNRSLVFDLATAGWVGRREDALFLGPPGSGKSHCAQAIGHAVIQQNYRVLYREAHALLEELADATLDGKRKEHMELLTTVPLLVIDDLGMRKLPLTAAEELLEAPPSPPCWIACCITDTCSSAARAVGGQKAAVRRKANDKSKSKGKSKSDMDAGQRTPGGVATRDPEASTPEPHHRNLSRNTKPSARRAHQANRRGSRSPIPTEPAPCHRPWITPQGATPAKRIQP